MKRTGLVSFTALALASLSASAAMAQTLPAEAGEATDEGATIIVTGTRASGITAAESPTPIKLLGADAIEKVGQPNLNQALTQLVPSFVAQAFGGDMANQTLQARLRGLSPNHTLVLVNGKRRHTTANFAVLSGPFQGGASADLDLISPQAIQRIEVLEQGAAAQYGSDAIAGVINILLKDNDEGGTAVGSYGEYYKGDGGTYNAQLNLGTRVGEAGWINLTGFYRSHGRSQRGGLDRRVTDMNGVLLTTLSAAQRALYPGQDGFPFVNKIVGDAKSRLYNTSYNAGYDLGDVQLYSFGTYSHKTASSIQNFRLADRVIRSPVLGVAGTLTTPGVILFDNTGFDPTEEISEDDFGITGGVKGETMGWKWDLSTTYGKDKVKLYTRNSANASLFVDTGFTPTDFYDGQFINEELTLNADFGKEFDVGMVEPMNVAFGAEYRKGTYSIGSGDPGSIYKEGGQSYPGFRPTDAGSHSRKSYSAYIDLALMPADGLKLDVAGRYEHYSDFGSKVIGKITGRYDITDGFALRGTVSNGFRAPTLAESFYSATNVAPTSATVQLPANSAAAKLVGFQNLKPEKSTTFSAGFVAEPVDKLTVTVDAYQIKVKDRIIGSGSIAGKISGVVCSPAANPSGCPFDGNLILGAIAAQGNILDPTVGDVSIAVFTNGVDTRTRGIDLTASYPMSMDFGSINWTLSANYNETKITKVSIDPRLIDAIAISIIEKSSPKWKVIAGATFTSGPLSITLREALYGPTSQLTRPSGAYLGPVGGYYKVEVGTSALTDLEVSYELVKDLTLTAGANNLFNKKPEKVYNVTLANGTGLRPVTGSNVWNQPLTFGPYGFNGGYYYGRITLKF
ncbi:TonB-dependent receptor plug domain-containing protein [Rhizorhabdus dicambivorans]|uniref:TonB-dependent receptor n=1 Tax=Rhizorhabdus dicambivorans TaxID=1850238 RepID=A0A2A4FWS0_9SPHN|nr:TonB-dependent receptor [Rhizorhabdus dicambivorans]ATE66936.1 TonB-dependent receptor [Rhizorhabdus dicambivorans]PCE42192.1 TonB-dependent receptor [Rhizorhabdus dicambivorans]